MFVCFTRGSMSEGVPPALLCYLTAAGSFPFCPLGDNTYKGGEGRKPPCEGTPGVPSRPAGILK